MHHLHHALETCKCIVWYMGAMHSVGGPINRLISYGEYALFIPWTSNPTCPHTLQWEVYVKYWLDCVEWHRNVQSICFCGLSTLSLSFIILVELNLFSSARWPWSLFAMTLFVSFCSIFQVRCWCQMKQSHHDFRSVGVLFDFILKNAGKWQMVNIYFNVDVAYCRLNIFLFLWNLNSSLFW
jgi:hypothetical protein